MEQQSQENVSKRVGEQKRPFILVVDGETSRQFITSMLLQRLGYHVFTVTTAEDALMILDLTVPSLLVTEINLPQMSGLELMRRLRTVPRTGELPVLIYTTVKDPAQRAACVQAGCAGYLVQPAEPNQLYEAVQKATEPTPRHFIRLATSLDVLVGADGIPGFVVRREKVSALSENGMYVNTSDPLPYGTVLPFTIFISGEHKRGGIKVDGKVLYSHQGGDGAVKLPGMGVKFVQIKHEDKELIKAYIRDKVLEGLAVSIQSPR